MAAVAQTDYAQLGNDLEREELENGATPGSIRLYCQLLAVYLLQNDMCNAKLLWKRIPPTVKQTSPELTNIWVVGQKMWLRDYAGIYEALQKEWSEEVKMIMGAVQESVRERALRLVRLAYSSISTDDLAQFLGVSGEKAVQVAQREGWQVDEQSRIITPKKIEPVPAPAILSEQHLSVLTDYVTFMEN
ncbi:COP9 signalosome complex subunit 8 [Aplysia californica]|uniref:COP9 signalosome complex subunit 8 n=1 Tax=Aplysia californica TaxID=6500 RepID=A0ABM0JUQ1_APLCA|nr:COP9 signalosome complex subunit 8 [Aplysia californica]